MACCWWLCLVELLAYEPCWPMNHVDNIRWRIKTQLKESLGFHGTLFENSYHRMTVK